MAVSSRAAAAWCERSHECPAEGRRAALDGGVTGSRALKGRSKCSRNMFPIIVYAFTAHNHRVSRVRNGRPREAARSVAVPSPAAASTGLSVRRRASTEHLGSAPGGPSQPPCPACTPSRPKFRENAASVAPWLRSPRSCCRYVGNHSRRAALRSPEHEYHVSAPPYRPAVDGRR